MANIRHILRKLFLLGMTLTGVLILIIIVVLFDIAQELPDVSVLKDIHLQVPLRIYSQDGKLMAEYGEKRRSPIPYDQIPTPLIDAVLATEDQRFFEHPGVDFLGLARATVRLVATGTKSQGGSTITMQVARNFFLSRKKTYTRKIKEILLAMKIEKELSKQKILDLYLNKIYYGNRAYGVSAAAQVYYGKPLQSLSLAQLAMIAGLPKAPSTLNPIVNPEGAFKRRNHALYRMYERGYITQADYNKAIAEPEVAKYHSLPINCPAPYISEMVRNSIAEQFGPEAYTSGLSVYTTINCQTQQAAEKSLTQHLLNYDSRHGYRGAIENLGSPAKNEASEWLDKLAKIPTIANLQPGAIISLGEKSASVILVDGQIINIPWSGLSWARKETANHYLGPRPQKATDILQLGDIVRVKKNHQGHWQLAQLPKVEGALVAMNPQNGAILALVGGFDYQKSNFNRVTQAKRQPGSSFKPFIYSAALAKGFTLASIINDAPIVINDPDKEDYWRPQNDTRRFYGPTRLRVALSKSRNLVSIRLLDAIGIHYAVNYLHNFGFDASDLPHSLSLALGTAALTPLQMAVGYAVIANGGYQITPYLVDHIEDAKHLTIYTTHPDTACESCIAQTDNHDTNHLQAHLAKRVISPQIAYLMTTALQDVIQHGTGRAARVLRRHDIGGKTGTTNDQKDGWFTGFNSDIVTIVWVGFDQPRSLHEYGSKAALPIWIDFMRTALASKPPHTMPQPPGIITIRIDPQTGLAALPEQKNTIFEQFREANVPDFASHTSDYSDQYQTTIEENAEQLF